jgi:hypothetical protein
MSFMAQFTFRLGKLNRRHSDPIREVAWTLLKEATMAFLALAHQPSAEKFPIERGVPLDILGHLSGAANDNELVWPLIPFPEDWWVV